MNFSKESSGNCIAGFSKENLGNGIVAFVSKEHTFGTDAVLLADFAAPKKSEIACDLGTGCGIIPLLWCREQSPKSIFAVDIQPKAISQLNQAIKANKLENRLKALTADLKKLEGLLPGEHFDLVVCNPPYLADNTGFKSPDKALLAARHEVLCTIYDVANAADYLLKYGGRLCICHRPERLCDVMEAMRRAGIEPKRLRFVQQRQSTAPWLFLVQGKKGAKKGLKILPPLVIEKDDGSYSEEMLEINKLYAQQRKTAAER